VVEIATVNVVNKKGLQCFQSSGVKCHMASITYNSYYSASGRWVGSWMPWESGTIDHFLVMQSKHA